MLDFDGALARVLAMLEENDPRGVRGRRRVLLGLAGPPGAGKTTLAERLVAAAADHGVRAAHVPMDGFHLADAALDALGRRERKGAADTFDGWGYRELLRRLAARPDEPVYAPGFERTLEQPIAGSIEVGPEVDLVVSEGNYLLLAEEPWAAARALCSEVWFCAAPASLRRDRLLARHVAFGKAPEQAAAWTDAVDAPNAALIEAARSRADAEVATA